MGRIDMLSEEAHALRTQECMMKYIPGGLYTCLTDKDLTVLDMNESFSSLFGYSGEEVREKFHNHFIEMVYPGDRDSVSDEMKKQLLCGDTTEIECRVARKDGKVLWILKKGKRISEEGRADILYCILLDITKQREEKERLRTSLERHRVIMDQEADIIFEWNIVDDTIAFSANWYKKFGYVPILDHVRDRMPKSCNIHSEDMKFFMELMEDTAAGVPYTETEFRIRRSQGDSACCRVRATTQYDEKGKPVKAVGVIRDITKEKCQRQALIDQAQRDSLTGLLHKNAAKQSVEDYLEGAAISQGIMLLIDLDDFKQVNDQYGHLCGDALIADTAGVLHREFRNSDIISRVGGDEFLVFLPSITERRMKERIHSLRQALEEIKVSNTKGIVSCSIGASIYPDHAVNFNSLYKCADLALYYAKSKKKGTTGIYSQTMEKGGFGGKIIRTAVSTVIDSELGVVNELLGQYSFRMLYDAIDVLTAVESLLEIIGRAYDVSRVYIFENSDDNQTTSNTFEWCNTGVISQSGGLQRLSFETDLGDFKNYFDENGIFYCGDINRLDPTLFKLFKRQGICSLLQCAIIDGGGIRGYVGFDECRESRRWTKEQIESLTLVSKVLSTFLLKHRLEEKVKRLENGIKQ